MNVRVDLQDVATAAQLTARIQEQAGVRLSMGNFGGRSFKMPPVEGPITVREIMERTRSESGRWTTSGAGYYLMHSTEPWPEPPYAECCSPPGPRTRPDP